MELKRRADERGKPDYQMRISWVIGIIGNALPPIAFAVSALLAYDAWTRIGPDTDGAIAEFVIAGVVFIFALRCVIDIYFYKSPMFVPQSVPSRRQRLRERIIVFVVGAAVALVAACEIAEKPKHVTTILGGGGVFIIGILVMLGAWYAGKRIDQQTVLRFLWWGLAGLFFFFWVGCMEEGLRTFLLFFPLGVFFTVLAVRASIQFHRFGRTELVWDHEPLEIGKTVRGRLKMSRQVMTSDKTPFIVRLRVLSHRIGRKSAAGGPILTEIWGRELVIPLDKVQLEPQDQIALPIEYTLPEHMPPSGSFDRTGYTWQLEVIRVMQGVDYEVSFLLLVVQGTKTADGSGVADVSRLL